MSGGGGFNTQFATRKKTQFAIFHSAHHFFQVASYFLLSMEWTSVIIIICAFITHKTYYILDILLIMLSIKL